jgi:hypothetical protein
MKDLDQLVEPRQLQHESTPLMLAGQHRIGALIKHMHSSSTSTRAKSFMCVPKGRGASAFRKLLPPVLPIRACMR